MVKHTLKKLTLKVRFRLKLNSLKLNHIQLKQVIKEVVNTKNLLQQVK